MVLNLKLDLPCSLRKIFKFGALLRAFDTGRKDRYDNKYAIWERPRGDNPANGRRGGDIFSCTQPEQRAARRPSRAATDHLLVDHKTRSEWSGISLAEDQVQSDRERWRSGANGSSCVFFFVRSSTGGIISTTSCSL